MRGVKPFVGIKNDEVISKIELGERLPLPAECPAPLFGLMNRCWSYDPDKRPDFRLVEASVAEILEEEKQLSVITSRRLAPDSVAPQKPPYRPHSSQGLMQVKTLCHVWCERGREGEGEGEGGGRGRGRGRGRMM